MLNQDVRVGQKYRTRGGKVVEILEITHPATGLWWPVTGKFLGGYGSSCWTLRGSFTKGGTETQDDLVELIIDPRLQVPSINDPCRAIFRKEYQVTSLQAIVSAGLHKEAYYLACSLGVDFSVIGLTEEQTFKIYQEARNANLSRSLGGVKEEEKNSSAL